MQQNTFTSLLKNKVKDTDEHPDKVGEVWEGPGYRSFCPHGAGVCRPPEVHVLTNLEARWTLSPGIV